MKPIMKKSWQGKVDDCKFIPTTWKKFSMMMHDKQLELCFRDMIDQLWENMIEKHGAMCESNSLFLFILFLVK